MSHHPAPRCARETLSIRVQNIPNSVSRDEVIALFNGLIGSVIKSEERFVNGSRSLVITFNHHDAYKKAMCMSGYTLSGTPMLVTSVHPQSEGKPQHPSVSKQDDMRRNLYVLGLPFDYTQSDFAALFSQYGTVSHCVILATRDSSSRRRGFVVMSTHEEAKHAITVLSRKPYKGIVLDISWAIVQRSQGFLDGGDRVMQLESRSSASGDDQSDVTSSTASIPPHCKVDHLPFVGTSATPTTMILVTNLPSALFSQLEDLHPLFCPFGHVDKIRILDSGFEDALAGKTSVLVDYANISSASEAKINLHGQFYAQYPVQAVYVQAPTASLPVALEGRNSTLNPFAAPFIHEARTRFCPVTAHPAQTLPPHRRLQHYKDTATGHYHSKYPSSLGIAHSTFYARRPLASRSSSASSRLSNDSLDHVPRGKQRHSPSPHPGMTEGRHNEWCT